MTLSPSSAAVGYLPQEPERRDGETVFGFLARRTGVAQAQRELDAATEGLVDGRDGADEEYSSALERWLVLGGADLEDRAGEVAAELGLAVGLDQQMTSLSGGQAARAGMASLLLSRYDIFLLDEPTNDLDLDGLERLERFVTGLRAGTVLVSHDREFLDRTVTRVVELDLAQQQVNVYGGGYAAYLAEREVARRHARADYEEYAGKRRRAGGSWPDTAGLGRQGRQERQEEGPGRQRRRQRQGRPELPGRREREAGRQGPADRARDRASRRGRGAPQGVGAADGDRRRAACRCHGGDPALRGAAAR